MITLLTAHITLLILSLILTASSAGMALARMRVGKILISVNVVATTVGLLSGAILLINHPIGSKCAALLTYLVVFVAVEAFVNRRNQALDSSLES